MRPTSRPGGVGGGSIEVGAGQNETAVRGRKNLQSFHPLFRLLHLLQCDKKGSLPLCNELRTRIMDKNADCRNRIRTLASELQVSGRLVAG